MRLDHVSYAAGPDGLLSTARRIGGLLGAEFTDGGVHPRFGTRNMILPLADGTYLEIVAVLDHPASDKAPFGQAVRACSAAGGGWLGWVVAVKDIRGIETKLGRASVRGNRHRPDGTELLWRQIGVNGMLSDGQLPFFVEWESHQSLHPSNGADNRFSLARLEIAGDSQRVSEWLGQSVEAPLEDVKVDWVTGDGPAGILAAQFHTPRGLVRI
ncbi:MAG: VOC family protein [Nocardioides sp.]